MGNGQGEGRSEDDGDDVWSMQKELEVMKEKGNGFDFF